MIQQWRIRLAEGHTETWLGTAIIAWAFFVILLTLYLMSQHHKPAVKWILAGILLYEVLP